MITKIKSNTRKYKATAKHGFLKEGSILSRGRISLMLLHELGVNTYTIDDFNKWLTLQWIEPMNNGKKNNRLSLNSIKNAIKIYLNVTNKAFNTKSRQAKNSYAKKLFSYFAKEYTSYSMREIGEYMRLGYDHSTVHWAHKRVAELIDINISVASDIYAN